MNHFFFYFTQMNNCLWIKRNIPLMHYSNRRSPSDYKYKCEDNSDGIYSGEFGGESAYNII